MLRQLIISLFLWALALVPVVQAQDTTNMLLNDVDLQLEITDAIDNMYNFKFAEAEVAFKDLRARYPQHPLPYFLLGMMEYWKIVPDEDVKDYDKAFHKYMDSAIAKAETMHKVNPDNFEASFFLAAAHGFNGRIYSYRNDYAKATSSAKKSLAYMDLIRGHKEMSPEVLFGDGIYNYYYETIWDEYPLLRPVMWFFPKGQKDLGLAQLEEVSRTAFYTRTEAMSYLLRFYATELNNYSKGYKWGKYLHDNYPDNPYFHRLFVSSIYFYGRQFADSATRMGFYKECIVQSEQILTKVNARLPFYTAKTARVAHYALGHTYFATKNYEKSQWNFEQFQKYSDTTGQDNGWYYTESLYHLGKLAEMKNDTETALMYYKKYLKREDKDDKRYKPTKLWVKEHS